MGQLASFTYLKTGDVPHLGFWSKPKPRLFRRPENRFTEFLQSHLLRESVFREGDGHYVALVFAWMEYQDPKCAKKYEHPLTATIGKNLGGAHWLVRREDVQLSLVEKILPESDWPTVLERIGPNHSGGDDWENFDLARRYTRDRFADLHPGETLLVSIG